MMVLWTMTLATNSPPRPPRGRFSHLSMFRVGALLFIPAYLSVAIYRPFTNTNGDGNVFVMACTYLPSYQDTYSDFTSIDSKHVRDELRIGLFFY